MAVLELRDVAVSFGPLAAVDGVSLAVHAGEIVGLIGPNGAGKTVTFNIATGLQRPDRGQVLLGGADVTASPAQARAALGLARTFQVVQLFAGMSVLDNLMVAAHRHTRGGLLTDALRTPGHRRAIAESRERATSVLAFLGIEGLAERDPLSLPAGAARLVELGRALCLQPRVLLLDEPASGLDPQETDALAALLLRIRSLVGCGILLVEHDMAIILPVCDHVVVMNAGRVLAAGSPGEIRADSAVVSAYLGVGL